MSKDNHIVGLDVGCSKVAVVVAEPGDNGGLRLLGIGKAPTEGLKRGIVVDLEKMVGSIHSAVTDAEMVSGCKINSVNACISGEHIKSINSRGVIAIGKGSSEITRSEVERVIEAARAVAIPADREIIHVLPQEFIVDDQNGIVDPIGMSGIRLEVSVHMVTGSAAAIMNVVKAIEKAGLEIEELILGPLAAAYAVLNPDERELGCVLIDMGAGTTGIAAFLDGAIKHTAVLGIGGKNVTNDIAIGLRTPLEQAERIKCQYGSALSTIVASDELITVPGVVGRQSKEVSRSVLAAIVEPRTEEIFSLVARELKKANLSESLASGIVLTGGASQLEGIPELAEQLFDLPAKLVRPECVIESGQQLPGPEFTASVGLVRYALMSEQPVKTRAIKKRGLKVFEKIKNIFSEYF
ncbi:MAG: cell division protein FtsA [Candidatus Zixiibacteriota bacterium]|nr:MAG: cell division protein FtsA [candidate division Zixibacteria bacterium]